MASILLEILLTIASVICCVRQIEWIWPLSDWQSGVLMGQLIRSQNGVEMSRE